MFYKTPSPSQSPNRPVSALEVSPNYKLSSINPGFACEILDKEMELEKTWDVRVVHELIGLYTRAVEHYEDQQDPRFYDYQEKIHRLLVRPQVIQALQSESGIQPTSGHQECKTAEVDLVTRKRQASEYNRKKLVIELNKQLTPSPSENVSLGKIVDKQQSKTTDSSIKALKDLKSQSNDLEIRLSSRVSKHNKSNLSYLQTSREFNSSTYLDESTALSTSTSFARCVRTEPDEQDFDTTDYSGFFSSRLSNDLDKRLEEIMEKNLAEKVSRISEITVNYKLQIKEIEGHGGLMRKIVEQMKINMQEEIKKVTEELDNKRKLEIEDLKKECLNML